jgi:hypothetical protein
MESLISARRVALGSISKLRKIKPSAARSGRDEGDVSIRRDWVPPSSSALRRISTLDEAGTEDLAEMGKALCGLAGTPL